MAVSPNNLPFCVAAAALVLIVAARLSGRSRGRRAGRTVRAGTYVALAGAAAVVIGFVLSSSVRPARLVLSENGLSRRAAGWQFAYAGRRSAGPDHDLVTIRVSQGRRKSEMILPVGSRKPRTVRTSWIERAISGDLRISLIDTKSVVLMPTASVTHEGWVSLPARIPGARSTVSLVGTEVTRRLAKLEYASASGKTTEFEVSKGRPALVDGYEFGFRRLVVTSSPDLSTVVAGVDLAVKGHGLTEKVLVQVIANPLMWVMWLGAVLMLAGGAVMLAEPGRSPAASRQTPPDA